MADNPVVKISWQLGCPSESLNDYLAAGNDAYGYQRLDSGDAL